MALTENHYKLQADRYRHYFGRIYRFYEQPSVRVSTALLLSVFTIIFFIIFAIRPTLTTVAQLIRKIEDQKIALEKLDAKATALSQAQQAYQENLSKIELLNQAVPEDYAVQDLIKYIEATAAYHQLPLKAILVNDVLYAASDSAKAVKTTQEDQSDLEFPNIGVMVSLEENYPNLRDFANDLVNMPRMVALQEISIFHPDEEGEEKTTDIRLNIQLDAAYLPKDANSL